VDGVVAGELLEQSGAGAVPQDTEVMAVE